MKYMTKKYSVLSMTRTGRPTWFNGMLILVASLAFVLRTLAAPAEFSRINAEFQKPDGVYVLVAAHRGLAGFSTGAWDKYPENSLAAIARSIELGVDIVEVDVHKTKDGHLILMHDATVDRTTDGSGAIANMTLAEIKQLHLKLGVGGKNAVTDQRVPTLEETMLLVKDKCMVNLDKAWKIIPECYEILKKTGTLQQGLFLFKGSYDAAKSRLAGLEPPPLLKVLIENKKNWNTARQKGWNILEPYSRELHPPAYELVSPSDDDPIFAKETVERIKKTGARVWINTMWNSLNGGHTDARSLKEPSAGWGWAVDKGANILQTDEAEQLLAYLRSRKLHW